MNLCIHPQENLLNQQISLFKQILDCDVGWPGRESSCEVRDVGAAGLDVLSGVSRLETRFEGKSEKIDEKFENHQQGREAMKQR